MQCKHGVILYGSHCINCQNDFEKDGVVCSEGQLKAGDKITIIGKSISDDQTTTVKKVITIDGNEEIITNQYRNKYFITKLVLSGESWAKQIQVTQ